MSLDRDEKKGLGAIVVLVLVVWAFMHSRKGSARPGMYGAGTGAMASGS